MAASFLRPLTRAERKVLTAKLRRRSLSARVHQRYRVIAEVRAGRSARAAADRVGVTADTALSSPAELGLPFTSWSVRTLTEYCKAHHLIPEFSDEWVRRVLRREGLSAQRIRTWKTSDDPAFGPKGGASAPSTRPARRDRRSSASTSGARSSSGR